MSIDLGTATVQIAANTDQLSRGIDGAKVLMLGLAAGAVAAAGEALKLAGNFEQSVNRLKTGAGDTQDSFAMLSKGILQVSVDTGVLTPALTNAMYLILSSGQRGAQAMDTLATASKGAQIEQANVVDVANVLSGAMHNFGTSVYTANDYMNGLIKAVSEGKITLQQLSVAMGPLEPLAHSLGVSYNDLAAAMTTQTNAMIPADRAATGLRFMMQALENPTHKATAEMTALGLSSLDVAKEMQVSLPGAMQMIITAALKVGPEGSVPFNRAVGDMVGGVRGLTAFLALSGPHMQEFVKNSQDIAASMKNGAGEVNGWALAQGNFNVQVDKAHAALDALAIKVGTELLPIVEKFMKDDVVPAITHFRDWSTNSTGLHDAFQTVVDVLKTLITDTEAIVSWFGKAGPQGTILKDVLVGIGLAVAGIKFAVMGGELATLATVTIPAALLKFGLIGPAATAAAAETTGAMQPVLFGMEGLATEELAVGTAATGMGVTAGAGFLAILGPIALAAAAVTGLTLLEQQQQAQFLKDNPVASVLPNSGIGSTDPFGINSKNATEAKDAKQAADEAAAAMKDLKAQIDKAWADMSSLYDLERSWAGYDPTAVNVPFFNKEIVKVDEIKAHLDDIKGPFTPIIVVKPVTDAQLKVIDFKAHLDDLKGPWTPIIDLHSVTAAQLKVIVLKSHIDDTIGPTTPPIGTSSIDAAAYKIKGLDDYIRNMPDHTVNVTTNFTQIGTTQGGSSIYGHASGGVIGAGQVGMVGEQGPELVYNAGGGGLGVVPAGQTAAMRGSGGGDIHVHNHIYLDSREMTGMLMNRAVKQIRTATGARI